jgi:TRAP-type C4-dicarboxylate transport system substrate-binding protein
VGAVSLTRASGVLLAALAVLAVGCGGGAAEGTKAGGDVAPVTLRIGTDDGPGRRSGEQIEEFARQVEALTEGQVRIEPVWQAAGDTGADDWDQKVARLVVDGELDLGLVPARAWDTEGVTTLRALNAPFLVTSDELTAEIVRSDVADTMLAGLDSSGVRGLALLPEGMRVVASFGQPLLSADDFAGTLLRVPASATTYAFFEALGATPDDVTANDSAVAAGDVDGVETALALLRTEWPDATATGNLPLWPKVTTLVVNAQRFDSLPARTREALERAATATRDWAIETTPSMVEDATAYCEAGGTIATASAADREGIERATAPVLADLRSDAVTEQVIEAIEAIAASGDFPVPRVAACDGEAGGASGPSEPLTAPGDPGDLPSGSYRVEFTPQYLRSIGLSEDDVYVNAGVYTWTFERGRWSRVDRPLNENVINNFCEGFYDVDGDRFTASVATKPGRGECAPALWSATWTLTGDTLTWTEVDPPYYALYFTGASGWQRVG